jgi:hypothetical protein
MFIGTLLFLDGQTSKTWKVSNKSMIFRISKNTGQKLLSYWSSNQRNPSRFCVVFLDSRNNAEFVTAVLVRCNSPASPVALPPQISKFPPSTHYSTALIKFRNNSALRMYRLTNSQAQPKCSVNILCCIPDDISLHHIT